MRKSLLILSILAIYSASAQQKQMPLLRGVDKIQNANKKANFLPGRQISFSWNTFDLSWELRDTTIFEYENGQEVKSTIKDRQTTISTYHENGRPASSITKYWNIDKSSWDTAYVTLYTLDEKGYITGTEWRSYENGQIERVSKERQIVTYGQNDQVSSVTSENFDDTAWIAQMKYDCEYKSNGELETVTMFNYDRDNGIFSPKYKYTNLQWLSWSGNILDLFQDIGESKILSSTSLDYNLDSSKWEVVSRSTNTYDSRKNELTLLDEDFDGTTWDTAWFTQYTYTYNPQGAMVEKIRQERHINELVNTDKYLYDNFDIAGSVSRTMRNTVDITVYPNPSNDVINFVGELNNAIIIIMDINGRVVLNREVSNGQVTIRKNELSNGIYFYNIVENDAILNRGKILFN